MKRFILLSFVFMGLGFYELSGGADFDPESAREAAMMARADREGIDPATVTEVLAAEVEMPKAERIDPGAVAPEVTRASLNLVTVDEVLRDPTPVAQPPSPAPSETLSLQSLEVSEPETTPEAAPEQQIILPSIAFAGNTLQVSSATVGAPRDIRFVDGVSVNMRAGPGTEHSVVTQLDRNTQVEILQDTGSGWVQLRPLAGGPTGWVADFLLTGS
jgi:hypothetical protein